MQYQKCKYQNSPTYSFPWRTEPVTLSVWLAVCSLHAFGAASLLLTSPSWSTDCSRTKSFNKNVSKHDFTRAAAFFGPPDLHSFTFRLQPITMENDAGVFVDLYLPRKWWVFCCAPVFSTCASVVNYRLEPHFGAFTWLTCVFWFILFEKFREIASMFNIYWQI